MRVCFGTGLTDVSLVSLKTAGVENNIETSSDLLVNVQFDLQFHLRSGALKPHNVQKIFEKKKKKVNCACVNINKPQLIFPSQ